MPHNNALKTNTSEIISCCLSLTAECSSEFSDDNQFLVIECRTADGSRVEYSVNGVNIGEGMEFICQFKIVIRDTISGNQSKY